MIQHDDDAGESLLAAVDLHAWRVPPPALVQGASVLLRSLSPATAPKRPRLRWILAAIVLLNAAIAAILVLVLTRSPSHTVTVLPAGGGSVDAQVRELKERLAAEEHELELKLAEIRKLQALVDELDAKLQDYERQVHELTVAKQRKTPTDRPTDRPIDRQPVDPFVSPKADDSCDEVSCVLGTSSTACCAKYRISNTSPTIVESRRTDIPESLDRETISRGVAGVKSSVQTCGDTYRVTGKVKVNVRVGANGRVTNVVVTATPDAKLGACVAAAVQRATFGRTQSGGSFTYPFVF